MDAINDATLGARLQGAQHFGLTVQNMDRAFEFYTEVLGGAEIMRDGDFHGGPIHNTILADQEIIAHQLKVDPRTIGVPDLKDGAQRLDVRFVQFDNFVIELLQYREADQPMGNGDSWAEPRDHMSPAYLLPPSRRRRLRQVRHRSRSRMRPSGDVPGQDEPHRSHYYRRPTKGRADERKG
jgi:catechol 2,3-dioxygenase-like lactoylglutathione lyase family enzyme